jgi:hypothetical protein
MDFVFHDGGRAAAGFTGKTGDCITRSIAIATGKTYQEVPAGPLLVKVSRHLTAVIDGVLYDTHNCSRDERRCVYGYFSLKS